MENMKRALVSGGSGALGSAICEQLAKDGFEVFIHTNNAMEAALILEKKITASGGSAKILRFDVTDGPSTVELLEQAAEEKPF